MLPCPPPGDLPNPGTEPRSPALQAGSSLSESPGVNVKLTSVCFPLLVSDPLNWPTIACSPKPFTSSFYMFCPVFYLFIYGCAGSLSLCAGLLQLRQADFSLQWLLLLRSTHVRERSSCSSRAAQYLWRMDLVAPSYMGSSWTRDQICVCCIGRRILYR